MQKFEQAVSYIENGEAEKGLQLLKEQLRVANDEEKYDIARYYHTLGFMDEALAITETYACYIRKKVNLRYF